MSSNTPPAMTDVQLSALAEAIKREEAETKAWRDSWRGREISPGVWRNWCCTCGRPLSVADHRLREKTDLTCDEHVLHSGNTIAAGAFSPDRKQSTR